MSMKIVQNLILDIHELANDLHLSTTENDEQIWLLLCCIYTMYIYMLYFIFIYCVYYINICILSIYILSIYMLYDYIFYTYALFELGAVKSAICKKRRSST
jgi:hypothetical protein